MKTDFAEIQTVSNAVKKLFSFLFAGLFTIGLSACSGDSQQSGQSFSKRVVNKGQVVPKGGGVYKIGRPYKIGGKWYRPRENTRYDRVGIASWYGDMFHGRKTANGEIYDMEALTAAHPTLPLPTYVRVTNVQNGRSLVVRVNDRGPYKHNRVIDLSRKTAELLGFERRGTSKVRVTYLGKAPLNGDDRYERQLLASMPWYNRLNSSNARLARNQAKPKAEPREWNPHPNPYTIADRSAFQQARRKQLAAGQPRIFVQAGAFQQVSNAQALKSRLDTIGKVQLTAVMINGRQLHRVRIGPFAWRNEAHETLANVVDAGASSARIVVE